MRKGESLRGLPRRLWPPVGDGLCRRGDGPLGRGEGIAIGAVARQGSKGSEGSKGSKGKGIAIGATAWQGSKGSKGSKGSEGSEGVVSPLRGDEYIISLREMENQTTALRA